MNTHSPVSPDHPDPSPKPTILAVDDTPENLDLIRAILAKDYRMRVARDGPTALRLALQSPPDLILLDIMMPAMDGYEVCWRLKADPRLADIPVIFVTGMGEVADESRGFDVGAVDYITKPISPPVLARRVRTHLALYDQNRELEHRVHQRTKELYQTRLQIIRRLGRAAEFKDNETGNHIVRMSHYTRLIGLAAGINEHQADLLFNAAPMHDIGKIGITDRILLKPGRLDADEWRIMRAHPVIGAEIIGEHSNDLLHCARLIALTHHEKWDGSGYPHGCKGADIPLIGRITAIADVFDALTSARPYKPAWPVADAVREIEQGSGSHFDPALLRAFQRVLPEIERIRNLYSAEKEMLLDHDLAPR